MKQEKVIVENKTVSVEDTKVKFGFNQITNPTPEFATKIFRAILYFAFTVNIVMPIFVDIPQEVRTKVLEYSMATVTAVHALTKLFGLNIENPKS